MIGRKLIRRQVQTSQLILAFSLVLLLVSGMLVHDYMSKKNILPSDSNRYDITELSIGLTSEFCPSATSGEDFEGCIQSSGSTPSFTQMTIPSLDQIIENGRPNFSQMVERVAPDLHKKIIGEGQDFVIKIELPEDLYTDNRFQFNFKELVINHMKNALICVDGNCKFPINASTWGLNTIALFKYSDSKTLPLYIFGRHHDWPYILSLQDGLFVASSYDLWVAKRFYGIYLNAEIFVFLLAFAGILFFLIWSAFVWKDYHDYSYLLYFGASFIFLAIVDRQMAAKWSDGNATLLYFVRSLAWWNAYISMQSFAFSTLRLRSKTQLKIATGSLLLASAVTTMNYYFCHFTDRIDLMNANIQSMFSLTSSLIPALICFYGGVICVLLHRKPEEKKSQEFEKIALAKRSRQQFLFAALLFFFNLPSLENFTAMLTGGRPTTIFTPFAAVMYIGIFITLIRPSMLRLKRAVDLIDRVSESATMKLILTAKQYREWKSRERSGIFIEADIKGSTSAIPELNQAMHTIMKILKQIIQKDLHEIGRTILLVKPLGDAWIFIVPAHNQENLSDALNEIALLCQKNSKKYSSILKSAQDLLLENKRKSPRDSDSIGLHLRIFASRSFYLQDRLEANISDISQYINNTYDLDIDLSKTHDSELDFIGEESHIFLRYLPKAPDGFLTVAGGKEILEYTPCLMHDKKMNLKSVINSNGSSQRYLQSKAEKFELSYLYLSTTGDKDHEDQPKIA